MKKSAENPVFLHIKESVHIKQNALSLIELRQNSGNFILIRFFFIPNKLTGHSSGFAQFEKKASHKWFPHFCCYNLRSIVLMMIFGLSDLLGLKHFTSGIRILQFSYIFTLIRKFYENKSQITKKCTDGNKCQHKTTFDESSIS